MTASEPEERRDHPGASPPPPFWSRFIATGFFAGYSPWASGTAGAIVGLLIFLIPGFSRPGVHLAAILIGFFVGAAASARVAAFEGNRLTKSAQSAKDRFQPDAHTAADPSIVVIDEIVGMWTSLLFVPNAFITVLCAFVAFRLFDIIKPYPVRAFERLPGGWGIMLDDIAAGIYANFTTRVVVGILLLFFPALL